MRFDEFSMTSVKSKLTIEGLNHIITIPRDLNFFILLDCHYMLLDITGGL